MFVPLTPIRCLYRGVDLFGNKTGVVCGARRFTYAEFGERCERLAAGLLAAGLETGGRVAYLSFNNHQLLEGYYGPLLARGITMPLNVRLTPAELIAILNHSAAKFLFYEDDFSPLVDQLRDACPRIEHFLSLGSEYEQFLAAGRIARPDIMTFDENATAELFYTSGSTGTPKGVMLSHRALYLHALSVGGCFNHDDAGVELHTIPLFHANGWGRPQTAIMFGLKQVMVRRFEPAAVLRLIEAEQATAMSLVPTMANALLHCPDLGSFDTSSLRDIHIGGAAASPELIDRLEQAFRCRVMSGYGLTETAPVATSSRPKSTVHNASEADRLLRMSMAGWPIPGVDIRVVDPAMHDVAQDMHDVAQDMMAVGEVIVRGDHVMDGYFKDPGGTEAVMTGAWFHTGDMAVWDTEGYIHIVDRKKDIIISGGENISSIEVEKAISAHPSVFECAVVAAPDAKWGEIPVAFVVLKPGPALSAAELLEFIAGRIAKFKCPREIEFVAGALPKTGTGKIVKRQLREKFWEGKQRRVQG